MSKKWQIPVTWQMSGVVCIEADTLEEAIDRANNDDDIGLPSGNYVDSSFEVTYDDPDWIRELYNHNQPDEEKTADLPVVTLAENLPEGWAWEKYDDGSGNLISPIGKCYFCYDRVPYYSTGGIEYKETTDGSWDVFWGSMSDFIEYAESVVNEKYLDDKIISHNNVSLSEQLQSASNRAAAPVTTSQIMKIEEVDKDSIQFTLSKSELDMVKASLDVMGDQRADREGYSSGEAYWNLKEKIEGFENKLSQHKTLEPEH